MRCPYAVAEKLRATLVDMKKAAGGDADKPKVAWATMLKYIGNVAKVSTPAAPWLDAERQLMTWTPRSFDAILPRVHSVSFVLLADDDGAHELCCMATHDAPPDCRCTRDERIIVGAQNPGEEKFRRIKLSNPAFQSKVAALPSSITFFEIAGFQVRHLHLCNSMRLI